MSLVGQTIGNYKVVQQIGEGGMGVVYMAEHPVIGRKVAIKLLHASFAHDVDTVARFFNEARAIHMIRHPNIVEILDFGQTTAGQPYFTMEFLVGESLADRIARGPVPWSDAVAIVSQICDALQAAHDKHIVHRDLKPHNVFLVGVLTSPHVKILDFGVAKMTTGWGDASQSGGQSVKTRTGSLMGTPLYMSPEQCRGAGKLDHRTDIYSLAVILFEMIAGHPPFMAEGVGELFAKHMLDPAPSLATFAPDTPPHIVAAVARALSKNLEDRFPDMKSMREALNSPASAPLWSPPGDAVGRLGGGSPATRVEGHAARVTPAPALPARATTLGIQSTTLSSSVSELDDSMESVPKHSRKGLALAILGAVALAGVALVMSRRPASSPQVTGGETARSNPPGTATAVSPPPPPPQPPVSTVSLRFEAEPSVTHVLRPSPTSGGLEDLGPVPLDVSMPRSTSATEFVLRADGHKDRAVRVDATRDRDLHFTLDRLAAAVEKRTKSPDRKPPPARPASQKAPHRIPLHDADGLAVPSF